MNELIRKQFVSTDVSKDAASGDRVRRFIISTQGVDRDNDTINAAGWQLDNYRANPVVLWAHDYSQLPVARALSVGVENGNLVATAEFATHDFANTVLNLIDGGFLRATSVGFRPSKVVDNLERGGYDFQEQELLEFSIVPVPANPGALIQARSAGVDIKPIQTWAKATLGLLKEFDIADEPVQAKAAEPAVEPEPAATTETLEEKTTELRMTLDLDSSDLDEALTKATALNVELAKAGRVLSRANESKVRQAKEMLDQVLAQLERAPEQPDEEDDTEEDAVRGDGTGPGGNGDDPQNGRGRPQDPKMPTTPCEHGNDPANCDACTNANGGQGKGVLPEDFVLELADDPEEFVLELADEDPAETFDIDPSMFRAMLAEVMREEIGGIARDATMATVARMRGRVD